MTSWTTSPMAMVAMSTKDPSIRSEERRVGKECYD